MIFQFSMLSYSPNGDGSSCSVHQGAPRFRPTPPLTAVEDAKQRSLAACQSTPAMKPIEPKPVKPVTSASKCSGKAERCMVVAWQLNHGQLDGIFRTFIYFG